jgi:hypothetical protein
MWGYDEISHRLHRIAAGDRLLGKKGYWIYSPGNLTTDPAMGTPVGTPTVLVQGWNLVSPAAACNPPGVGSVAAAWYWDAEDTRYRMVAHDEQLQPGVGYWLNARQAGVVDLD